MFGDSKTMNIIRTKIIASWLLLVSFGLLLCFSWRHRFLWMALFCAAFMTLELIKPRRSQSMPPRLKALLCLMVIVWALTVFVHGILFPFSAGLYLFCKIVLAVLTIPVLCYKAYADYLWSRSSSKAA